VTVSTVTLYLGLEMSLRISVSVVSAQSVWELFHLFVCQRAPKRIIIWFELFRILHYIDKMHNAVPGSRELYKCVVHKNTLVHVMQEKLCAFINFIFRLEQDLWYFYKWNRHLLLSQLAKRHCASRQPIAIVPRRTASPIFYASDRVTLCSRRSFVSVVAAQRKYNVIIYNSTQHTVHLNDLTLN